ncbi:type VI secretion system Vgr family protein [Agarilytica rhodophyticola]|uniref:type VI secretion system Vgr family protein n=1 Tax=Agarilytica rhodophyticola TaxID=1737490 RepID=UPI000B348292|nr:type VI secretion system tip protein TssI/VgrG [Agarilytica rhodophyticola]
MAHYTKEHRLINITDFSLGKDSLLISGFKGTEYLSRPFEFEITVLSTNLEIQPEDVVGKDVTVTIQNAQQRPFHGFIVSFVFGEIKADDLREYKLTMVPWLWFLTQTNDHRIFQHQNTKEIVSTIFNDLGFTDFEFRAEGGEKREYCIQHNESDFHFISRLLEEDGISYYFKHENSKHQLVLVDQKHSYDPCAESALEYSHGSNPNAQIHSWQHQHNFRKGRWALNDYDFKTPDKDLKTDISTVSTFENNSRYEHYEYPALYGKALGRELVKKRMEAEESTRNIVIGGSNYSSLYAGGRFSLTKHTTKKEKGDYILTSVTHEAYDNTYTSGEEGQLGYDNSFTCIPADVHIRPTVLHKRPVMRGSQTAEVVGPAGEEIYVDEFGRIKVQFIWDREGKKNENSTCFMRVSQTWAGNKWGASFIPRIGHEVIVDFFDGDPDRPYISGSVYNGKNRPPYTSKTQSGIKTRSTKGGTADNYNEIRFDDKKGSEQIYVHAEKNMDTQIENNETLTVDNDRTKTVKHDENSFINHDRHKTVDNDQSETIGKNKSIDVGNNHTENIGKNVSIDVGENHTETIGKNMTITVRKDLKETVEGNYTEAVTEHYKFRSKTITMDADDQIIIQTGAAKIMMKNNGDITISGKTINVKGSSDIIIKGSKVSSN